MMLDPLMQTLTYLDVSSALELSQLMQSSIKLWGFDITTVWSRVGVSKRFALSAKWSMNVFSVSTKSTISLYWRQQFKNRLFSFTAQEAEQSAKYMISNYPTSMCVSALLRIHLHKRSRGRYHPLLLLLLLEGQSQRIYVQAFTSQFSFPAQFVFNPFQWQKPCH